jgi:hypothetical protein
MVIALKEMLIFQHKPQDGEGVGVSRFKRHSAWGCDRGHSIITSTFLTISTLAIYSHGGESSTQFRR